MFEVLRNVSLRNAIHSADYIRELLVNRQVYAETVDGSYVIISGAIDEHRGSNLPTTDRLLDDVVASAPSPIELLDDDTVQVYIQSLGQQLLKHNQFERRNLYIKPDEACLALRLVGSEYQ